MKRLFTILAALALMILCATLLPTEAQAATITQSGTCGANLTWTLDNAGTLTISGTGTMENYTYSSTPWYSSRYSVKTVVIEDGVTSIGLYAFYYCTSLTSVSIPDSVTSIGNAAFYNCTSLTSVTIPDSVTSIGSSAFYNCTRLTSVTIGDSVTSIGLSAFDDCTELTCVNITDLEAWCKIGFSNSYANPLYYAKNLYLNGKLVTDLVISNSVTSIGSYAFEGCSSLTSVSIPDSVTFVGEAAFDGCGKLTYNLYGNGKYLGNADNPYVYLCGLQSDYCDLIIPHGVRAINADAFVMEANDLEVSYVTLRSVYISNLAEWCDISFGTRTYELFVGGIQVFDEETVYGNPLCYASKLYINGKLATDLVIPNSVTKISDYAFKQCNSLTSVTIPDSVTSIGDYAFEGCSSLTNVTYCGTEEQWNQISIDSGNTYLTDAQRSYHNWEGEATCTTQQVCTICGQKEYDHVWIDATCTSLKYCFICGMTEGEYGHTWIAANCTKPKTCASCGVTEGTIQHAWNSATCTTAKTCSGCGVTEGKALGHSWVAASCKRPKTCTTCGATEGVALGHSWVAATCTTPKTCTTCGKTEGSVQHNWVAATCTTPKTCSVCGATEGVALGHSWQNATCQKPKHCTVCGVTEGTISGHTYSGDSDAFCNVCNHQRIVSAPSLKFYGVAGLSFQEYIGIQILAKNELLANYDKAYVVIVQETPDGDVESTSYGRLYASKYTIFEQKIVSWSMTEQVTMTLYAEKNGVIYRGASITTSVKQLAMDKLATYKAQDNTKACRALVDMLNYGAAVQTTYNHNAENLPTADLGEYAVYGTTEEPTFNATNDITGSGSVKVYVNNISLQDKVEFQFLVKTTELNNRTVKAILAGVPVDAKYKEYNSTYTIVAVAVAAAHMRDTYTIALCDTDGNAVTQVYNVSVEAYAKEQLSADRGPALIAMMKYGDSVAALL